MTCVILSPLQSAPTLAFLNDLNKCSVLHIADLQNSKVLRFFPTMKFDRGIRLFKTFCINKYIKTFSLHDYGGTWL